MRKLLLLIPVLAFALTANATVISITTTSPHSSNNLRQALAAANSGDIIEMAGGIYAETGAWIAIDDKSVTVRAAAGAEVIIKPQFGIRVKAGDENQIGKVEFIGVQFDCSVLESAFLMGPSDDKANQSFVLKNCEFYNWAANSGLIQSTTERRLDAVEIDNCYFHGFAKSIVFLQNTNPVDLSITNSTFANVTGVTDSYDAAPIDVRAASGSVLVDHCTFYNVNSKSLSYGTVTVKTITDPVVSNCIFMLTASVDMCATYLNAGGDVKNCLTYNYDNWQACGHYETATLTDCFKANPVFKDAVNGDYTLRMGSPARGAGLAGSNLGDPRWSAVPEPIEANFATPLTLEAADAVHNEYFILNADNNFKAHNPNPATEYGIATWQIHATKEVAVQVTLNINSASLYGHTYKVEIFDSSDDKKGEVAESGWTDTAEPVTLSGLINIPSAGYYTVKLSNTCNGSGEAIIEGITLAYAGGAVIEVPANTLEVADAIYSANGTRADGMISFPSATVTEGWVKWNINVTAEAFYDVALTIKNQYEHNMTISFYEEDGVTLVGTVSEGGNSGSAENTVGHALNLGGIYLPVGNYVAKVTNARTGSDAKIMSVGFTYAGGNVINVSPSANTTLPVADAWFTQGFTRADGQVSPGSWKPEGKPLGYVKWNIATSETKFYDLTLNFSSDNAHSMAVNIYEDEEASPVATVSESYTSTYGTLTISDRINLVGGKNYVVVVTNPTSGSHAKVTSVVFAPEVSLVTTLPNTLDFSKAVLSEKAKVVGDELHFGEGEPGAFTPVGQWAQWEVTANAAGTFLFTMGVNSTLQQSYRITILDNLNNVVTTYDKNPGSGSQSITHYFYLEAGTYFVKVENTYSYSDGYIVSLVVSEPSLLSLDETATSAPAPVDAQNIQIMRTFVGGMYNTICLPFGVGGNKLKEVFGSDVVLKKLNSAEFYEEGGILELNFEDAISGGAYQGTPYLIKPSQNIVNPVFESVEILSETHAGSTSRHNADFIGTFVATDIPAGENNLFLGPNNKLYFSETATPIMGMRAYFQIKGVSHPSQAIKLANIIANDQVVTSIDFTKGRNNKVMKAIENGQLIIIRNGERFTVQGQRIQ